MADHSHIEWTEATWNPIAGCSIVSPGCTNCYAMRRVAPRLAANPATPHYAGTVQPSKGGYVWTGKIGIASDRVLTAPLRWRRPRMIFVNSTSDLFHPDVPDEVVDRIFAVMALCPQHTFQVLTKRPERMREYLGDAAADRRIHELACEMVVAWQLPVVLIADRSREHLASGFDPRFPRIYLDLWPLPNVWLGTSVEDQRRADERIPALLDTPAAVRFLSVEPLLGPIELAPEADRTYQLLSQWYGPDGFDETGSQPTITRRRGYFPKVDWVIVGGESGNGARPMHPHWARSLRDQCAAAGVPFFFKQWGEWAPAENWSDDETIPSGTAFHFNDEVRDDNRAMWRVGKKAAGRVLDGIEHNGMPGARP